MHTAGAILALHDVHLSGFPFELFRELRDQRPVWRHATVPTWRSPEGVWFWVVLGHPEVQMVSRDPRVFADPDRFDIQRNRNPHVSFGGGGVHHCLGAHLARREINVMFSQLLRRFPAIEIAGPMTHLVTGLEQTVAVSLDRIPVRLNV